jgi:hypothetical protein
MQGRRVCNVCNETKFDLPRRLGTRDPNGVDREPLVQY